MASDQKQTFQNSRRQSSYGGRKTAATSSRKPASDHSGQKSTVSAPVLKTALLSGVIAFLLYIFLFGSLTRYLFHYLYFLSVADAYFLMICASAMGGVLLAGILVRNPLKKNGGLLVPCLFVWAGMLLVFVLAARGFTEDGLINFRMALYRVSMPVVYELPYAAYEFLSNTNAITYVGDGLAAAIAGLISGAFLVFAIYVRNSDKAVTDTFPSARRARHPGSASSHGKAVSPVRSTSSELEKYQALVDADIMTPEEFEVKKRQLLKKQSFPS